MVSTKLPKTGNSVGSVLRVYGNGQVFVEDVYKYLADLEYAYNCAYVLHSILGQAEELAEYYGASRPPIPIKNLLWASWWPPNPEKVAGMVPPEEKLQLQGVQFNSPGFWDFFGQLNPLEVLRQYVNDQHERRKEREDREPLEARKGLLEIEQLELENLNRRLELLKQLGPTEQDLSILKYQLLSKPLEKLNSYQDQRLIVDAEIVNPEQPKKKESVMWGMSPDDDIELKSEKGIDYTKLRDLLAAGKWKEADQETAKVMLQAANRVQQRYLDVKDIDNFPCEDLRTIDQLWVKYSQGRFGFSVQKKIYISNLGGTKEYNEEVWKKFGDHVGWRKGGNWLNYSDLTFELRDTTPYGHLPLWDKNMDLDVWCVFSRVKTCNL